MLFVSQQLIMHMKISETWNQAFQQMRFDSNNGQGHLINDGSSNRQRIQKGMFESQELPNEEENMSKIIPREEEYKINLPRDEDSNIKIQEKYEYSQTDQNRSQIDQRIKEKTLQQDDPSLCIFENSQLNPVILSQKDNTQEQRNFNELSVTQQNGAFTRNLSPLPPHYPPSPPHLSHIPNQQPRSIPIQNNGFKSLDNVRNITQQSYAPSQKTIVVNHLPNQNPNNQIYRSHVLTEKMMPVQNIRDPNVRHSHVNDRRAMVSPGMRINFDYVQPNHLKPQGFMVNNVYNSYIPANQLAQDRFMGQVNVPLMSEGQYIMDPGYVQATVWKEKFEEMTKRWQTLKLKEMKEHQSIVKKFDILEQKNHGLQENLNHLKKEYSVKVQENQRFIQQIQELQRVISEKSNNGSNQQYQNITHLLKEKQIQIQKLNNYLADKENQKGNQGEFSQNMNSLSSLQSALDQKTMLINFLKNQNNNLMKQLQQISHKYEQDMRDMNEHQEMLQMELQQKEGQLQQTVRQTSNIQMKRSDNSQMILERSRMESFENNSRVMEMEMHINKLNAELNMRDQAYDRELKMANLKISELIDRLKALTAEKDQIIRSLQQKVSILEGDLNKKDSVVRNMKDQMALMSHTHKQLSKEVNVYSSAVGSMDSRVGDQSEVFRRELDNMRKNLFQREREKMILKQKYQQLQEKVQENEQALNKKKIENQNIRRQLNDFDNLHHQNDMLMEVLNKKNSELMEMKEMLLEKEQHTGEYQILSKQNQKLRDLMVKKNEELSDMADKLYNQQKKKRQIQMQHSPRVNDMQEQIQKLQQMLHRKQQQINKLNQSLELVQSNFSEVEFELERHKNAIQEYETAIKNNMDKLQEYDEEFTKLEEQNHQYQEEINYVHNELNGKMEELNIKNQSQQQLMEQLNKVKQQYEQKIAQLQEDVRQTLQLKQYKEKSCKQIQNIQSRQIETVNRYQILSHKYKEVELAVKQRDNKIHRLEKEMQEMTQNAKKHTDCKKQIEHLTDKISEYELKIIKLNISRSSGSLALDQSNQVFQNKIIYQLKRENQKLKLNITGKQEIYQNNQGNTQKDGFIKNRLDQFQNKLEHTIQRKLSNQSLTSNPSKKTLTQRTQQEMLEQQNKELERLKRLTQRMQKEEHMKSQQMEEDEESRRYITPEYIEMVFEQQVNYYRNKNSELEARINSHIKVNKDLKCTLQSLLQKKDSAVKQYYQIQLKRINEAMANLQKQNKHVKSQRKRLQEQVKNYEDKFISLDQMADRQKRREDILNHADIVRTGSPEISYRYKYKQTVDSWQEPMH